MGKKILTVLFYAGMVIGAAYFVVIWYGTVLAVFIVLLPVLVVIEVLEWARIKARRL